MKKTLFVLNDAILLSEFKSWIFTSSKKDTLFLAKSTKEAIDIMQSHSIDLVLTELNLPEEVDGLELLAGFYFYQPLLEVVILLPSISNAIEEEFKELTSFYFIKRPDTLKDFTNLIDIIDTTHFKTKILGEIVISDFFGLIEVYKKTCLLAMEMNNNQKKGMIYFEQGILYDAVCGELKAESAVIEMLSWEHAKLSFKSIEKKKFRKKIQLSLNELLQAQNQAKVEVIDKLPIIDVQPEFSAEIDDKIATEVRDQSDSTISHIRELPLEEILQPIQEMDDYLASAIFDMMGNVLVQHNISSYSVESIGENAIIVIKSALDTSNNIGLGKCNFIQINSENTIFQAVWLLEDQFFVTVLLKPAAKNTGLAKMMLAKVCDAIHGQLI